MKTPEQLRAALERQWHNADHREARLLGEAGAWPVRLSIGKPSATIVASGTDALHAHVRAWQRVETGSVEWQALPYRAVSGAIELPLHWRIDRPSEWIAAVNTPDIRHEYETMCRLCEATPQSDHATWIRRRSLWSDKDPAEIIRASQLADALEPACAQGRPLRALPYAGVDTKFYERHRALLIRLLDLRHNGAASEQGLEVFLDAAAEKAHWLLVADLDGRLLPFAQQRVRADELAQLQSLPGNYLIIIENERALHLLPKCQETLAVLGSGNNLNWLSAGFLAHKQIAYWGDLDTWGLRLLAHARQYRPELTAILMDFNTFSAAAIDKAVVEPERAPLPEEGLKPDEQALFQKLSNSERGRLEQEFLPETIVHKAVGSWRSATRSIY